MSKQTAITKSARGQECQIRVPYICNHNTETTVLAHLNGGGMAKKRLDIHGAFSCSDCHSFVDGGWTKHDTELTEVLRYHYEGVFRTQEILIEKGLLAYPGIDLRLIHKIGELKHWVKALIRGLA